jgi:hypothetical protein
MRVNVPSFPKSSSYGRGLGRGRGVAGQHDNSDKPTELCPKVSTIPAKNPKKRRFSANEPGIYLRPISKEKKPE